MVRSVQAAGLRISSVESSRDGLVRVNFAEPEQVGCEQQKAEAVA
jgi:hypothetical protein